MDTPQGFYRQHQGTWEQLKNDMLKRFTVGDILEKPDLITAHLEFYDHEINWCIRKQLT